MAATGLADTGIDGTVARLHREHALTLVRMANLLLRDPPAAEDVVQDAFVSLYQALPRLTDHEEILPYLRVAVFNRARSALRARARAQRRAVQHERPGDSAESVVLGHADRAEVLTAVGRLPRRRRHDRPAAAGPREAGYRRPAGRIAPSRIWVPLAAAAAVAALITGAAALAPAMRSARHQDAGTPTAGQPAFLAATAIVRNQVRLRIVSTASGRVTQQVAPPRPGERFVAVAVAVAGSDLSFVAAARPSSLSLSGTARRSGSTALTWSPAGITSYQAAPRPTLQHGDHARPATRSLIALRRPV
jgi:hypothetical protein